MGLGVNGNFRFSAPFPHGKVFLGLVVAPALLSRVVVWRCISIFLLLIQLYLGLSSFLGIYWGLLFCYQRLNEL